METYQEIQKDLIQYIWNKYEEDGLGRSKALHIEAMSPSSASEAFLD